MTFLPLEYLGFMGELFRQAYVSTRLNHQPKKPGPVTLGEGVKLNIHSPNGERESSVLGREGGKKRRMKLDD